MAQFVVRNIEKEVKSRLKRRAAKHGRSMEEEVREILRSIVSDQEPPTRGLGSEIAALFASIGLDQDIPELRGRRIKPASFGR